MAQSNPLANKTRFDWDVWFFFFFFFVVDLVSLGCFFGVA